MSIEKTSNEAIGKRIQLLREEKGMTQAQFAAALGTSNRENIARWEAGTRELKAGMLVKISNVFNVSVDYLLGLSGTKSTDPDVQIAAEVTGLSEKAINNLSNMKKSASKYYKKKEKQMLCPVTIILDHLITSGGMHSICFSISWLLNEKRKHNKAKSEIEQRIQIMKNENIRLRGCPDVLPYQTEDLEVVLDLENELDWYNFRKWEFSKRIEDASEEIINSSLIFYFDKYLEEEVTDNAQHHQTQE